MDATATVSPAEQQPYEVEFFDPGQYKADKAALEFQNYLTKIRSSPLPVGIEDGLAKHRLETLVSLGYKSACASFDAQAASPTRPRNAIQDVSREVLARDVQYQVLEGLAFLANGRDGYRPLHPEINIVEKHAPTWRISNIP